MIGSGSCIHVCPSAYADEFGTVVPSERVLDIRGAGGEKLLHYGNTNVTIKDIAGQRVVRF